VRKILVVDDNPAIRQIFPMCLEREGYRVETAADGIAGLEAIAWFKPDLILLNLMMPRMDGFAMLKALQQHPPVPVPRVVIITGASGQQMVDRVFSDGAVDIIFYPANLSYLKQVVGEVLEPAIDVPQRRIGVDVRQAIDAAIYLGCASGIDATRRLPMGRLSIAQRTALRGSLLKAIEKDLKKLADAEWPTARWGKAGPHIDPLLIAMALAGAL
jgi:CheY-like chemotaxis protein